jgi:hypothetical protein
MNNEYIKNKVGEEGGGKNMKKKNQNFSLPHQL